MKYFVTKDKKNYILACTSVSAALISVTAAVNSSLSLQSSAEKKKPQKTKPSGKPSQLNYIG